MTRWPVEDATRRSYDTVARAYAVQIGGELARKPFDRALLRMLAEDAGDGASVVDLGCGPGHVAAHLADLNLVATGIDLSPAMIEVAREQHSSLTFRCASMLELDSEERFDSAVAFYSLIHFDPTTLRRALDRIRSTLIDGAPFLVAVHVGEGVRHVEEMLGDPVDLDFVFLETADVQASLRRAGFTVEATTVRAPYSGVEVSTERAYVHARAT